MTRIGMAGAEARPVPRNGLSSLTPARMMLQKTANMFRPSVIGTTSMLAS